MRVTKKMLRAALAGMLKAYDPKCEHKETHRGGAIWTICDECGAEFADDRGGIPVVDNSAHNEARALLEATK